MLCTGSFVLAELLLKGVDAGEFAEREAKIDRRTIHRSLARSSFCACAVAALTTCHVRRRKPTSRWDNGPARPIKPLARYGAL